jgi:RNA polymerase sigma-70 factor (ECF subfamily)
MSDDPSLHTVQLHKYVQRWQAGDSEAADQLFRTIASRLEKLARRMLRGYPNVRAWADTGDVMQGAVWRLLNTLRRSQPPSTRDFFNLAANHIRCELIDLARRYSNRQRPGTMGDDDSARHDPAAPDLTPPDELELWTRFHEAVEQLPSEEREVLSLWFYHGWTWAQIAEMFGVHERTIRRRWHAATSTLHLRLGGQLPAL